MSARDRAGLVIKIVNNGSLNASALASYGPCDALKADSPITVSGTPADALVGETVSGFPVEPGIWDPTGWSAITAISGTGSYNVWAGWYSRKAT